MQAIDTQLYAQTLCKRRLSGGRRAGNQNDACIVTIGRDMIRNLSDLLFLQPFRNPDQLPDFMIFIDPVQIGDVSTI